MKAELLFALGVACLAEGCSHTVNLNVKNSAKPALDVSIATQDRRGLQGPTTHLGNIAPGKSAQGTTKVKNGGSYAVKGNLPQGANVYPGSDRTVAASDPDPLNDTVEIVDAALSGRWVDPNDTSEIEQFFGQLGPNVGFNPVTVPSALNAIFGGLVWYTIPAQGVAETLPVVIASPSLLTGATTLAQFAYPDTQHQTDTAISTDASVKASASVPLWGSLTAAFSANNVYKLHWDLEGFGNIQKAEPDGVSYQDKMNALSQATKADLCNRLKTQNSLVMYVNEMYVVRSAILSYQQGTTISAGASLSGGSIIAGSVAYDFSSSQQETSRADGQVVNIAGPTWTKDTLGFCTAAGSGVNSSSAPTVTSVKVLPGRTAGALLNQKQ